jgi:cell division initiation protein
MEISGQILREVEFRDRLRGYDTDEVDEFLEKVAVAVDKLVAELAAARDKLARHTDTGVDDDSLRRTLVLAQRTADLAVREARDEAAALIEDARLEATALTAEAREEAGRMRSDAERDARAQIAALEARRVELKRQVEELERIGTVERSRLSAALKTALDSLGEATVAEWAATTAAEEPDDADSPLADSDALEGSAGDEDTAETPRMTYQPIEEPPRQVAEDAFEVVEDDDEDAGDDDGREDPPHFLEGRTLRAVEPDDDDPDEMLWQRWARGADLDAVPNDREPTVRPKPNHTGRRGSSWTA